MGIEEMFAIKKIRRLNLNYLVKKLRLEKKWSPDKAREAVRKYKNFLILKYKYPKKKISPTRDVDEAWHAHILHTYRYMQDCGEIFGAYLHHQPASTAKRDLEMCATSYLATAELYYKEFKEIYI